MFKEQEFLRSIARLSISGSMNREIISLAKAPLDWEYIADKVMKHKLGPLIYDHINRDLSPLRTIIPELVLKRFLESYANCAIKVFYAYRSIETIGHMCNLRGIRIIVIKGIVISGLVFRNLSIRETGDLDIIVYPEDTDKFLQVLADLGYSCEYFIPEKRKTFNLPAQSSIDWRLKYHYHYEPMIARRYFSERTIIAEFEEFANTHVQSLKVDDERDWIMRKLLQQPFDIVEVHHSITPPSDECYFDVIEAFDRSMTWKLGKHAEIGVLAKEDMIIQLCHHLFREATHIYHISTGNDQMIRKYCDVLETLHWFEESGSDAQVLIGRVLCLGMEKPVYYTLYHLAEFYKIGDECMIQEIMRGIEPENKAYLDSFYVSSRVIRDIDFNRRIIGYNALNKYKRAVYNWKTTFRTRIWKDNNIEEAERTIEKDRNAPFILECRKVNEKPVFDDSLSSGIWRDIEEMSISEERVPSWQPYGTHVQMGYRPKSDAELSASFKVCWNAEFLYFKIDICDDHVVTSNTEPVGYFHDQDAVVVYLQAEGTTTGARYFLLLRGTSVVQLTCVTQRAKRDIFYSQIVDGVQGQAQIGARGYKMEFGIPFSAFRIEDPRLGTEILFDIEIEDCDSSSEGTKTTLAWFGSDGRSNHALSNDMNFYRHSDCAKLRLVN